MSIPRCRTSEPSSVIHARQTVLDDMRNDQLFANRVGEFKRQLEMLQ